MAAIKFSKQYVDPNPNEVDYWIDLTSNPYGGKIKYNNGIDWVDLIGSNGSAVDFDNYFNKDQINEMLANKASVDSVESKVDDTEIAEIIKNIEIKDRGNSGVELVLLKYDDTTIGVTMPIASSTTSGVVTSDDFKNLVKQYKLQEFYTEMYEKLADIRNSYQPKLKAGKNITIDKTTNTIHAIGKISTEWKDLINVPDFKPVATSGDYNDLINKPDETIQDIKSTLNKEIQDRKDAITTEINDRINAVKTEETRAIVRENELSTRIDNHFAITDALIESKADKSDTYTKKQIDQKLSGVYRIKGSCSFEQLPLAGNTTGDVYIITNIFTLNGVEYPVGTNVVYTENGWVALSGVFDTTELENAIQNVSTNLTNEIVRATEAEQLNATDITNIDNRLKNAEESLNTINGDELTTGSIAKVIKDTKDHTDSSVTTEKNRATEAENKIASDLSTAKTDIHNQISSINETLSTEISAREAFDTTISTNLTNEINRATTRENKIEQDYIASVQGLQSNVNDVNTSLTNKINVVDGKLVNHLPLSGGTINGEFGALSVKRNKANPSAIKFENINGTLGYIGLDNNSVAFIWDPLQNANIILHSGNYSSYALPLNGGKIGFGNSNSFPLSISSTSDYSGIHFESNVGHAYFRYTGNANWNVTDDGWTSSYDLLHSGNYSNYALPTTGGTLTASGNPLTIKRTDGDGPGLVFESKDTRLGSISISPDFVPKFYNANVGSLYTIWHLGNDGSGSGLDADLLDGLQESNFCRHLDEVPTTSYRGIGYGFLDSGWIDNGPALSIGNSDGNYLMQLQTPYYANVLYFRSRMNDTWGSWKTIAFTDSNVASATKLQTARTIWGQSFDGTGDVSGVLFDVNQITFDSNKAYGIFRGNFFLGALSETDLVYYSTKHVFAGGNVGIGTMSPTYKLDVHGSIRASMETIANVFYFTSNEEKKGWFGSPNDIGATDFVLNVYPGGAIRAYTDNVERIRITSNGDIGIGTENPEYKLDVNGNVSGDFVDWYGVSWSENSSDPTCTRIGNMAMHKSLPILSAMKGYYISNINNRTPETIIPINESWTNLKYDLSTNDILPIDQLSAGNIMVKIPEFWYIDDYEPSTKTHNLKISQTAKAGWCHHKEAYVGAYEGVALGDLYKSTKGLIPTVNVTRTEIRSSARSNGYQDEYKWNIYTYEEHRAICHLFLVEYATRNSQAPVNTALTADGFKQGGLGSGCTTGAMNNTYSFIPTGTTDSLGNGSGQVAYTASNGVTYYANRYRGIENPFGHIWKHVDDVVNVYNADTTYKTVYKCNKPEHFATNRDAKYKPLCSFPGGSKMQGWSKEIKATINCDFFKYSVGGSESTYWCDYNYDNDDTTEHCILIGGRSGNGGGPAGLFYFALDCGVGYSYVYVGSRLTYLPWAE